VEIGSRISDLGLLQCTAEMKIGIPYTGCPRSREPCRFLWKYI